MDEGQATANGPGARAAGAPDPGAGPPGWRVRLAEGLFGDVLRHREARHEVELGRLAESGSLADEDRGWRGLSFVSAVETPHATRLEELRDSYEAYRVNPIAYRLIELTTDFVLGRGAAVTASEPDIDDWLQAWWTHPENRLPLRAKMRVLHEKHLLKEAGKNLVPPSVLARPKQPYRAPDGASFFGGTSEPPAALLPDRIRRHGIFDPGRVCGLVQKFQSGKPTSVRDNMALVGILSTQLLLDRFLSPGGNA